MGELGNEYNLQYPEMFQLCEVIKTKSWYNKYSYSRAGHWFPLSIFNYKDGEDYVNIKKEDRWCPFIRISYNDIDINNLIENRLLKPFEIDDFKVRTDKYQIILKANIKLLRNTFDLTGIFCVLDNLPRNEIKEILDKNFKFLDLSETLKLLDDLL